MGVQEAGRLATVHLFLLPEKKHFHLLQKGTELLLKLKFLDIKKPQNQTEQDFDFCLCTTLIRAA